MPDHFVVVYRCRDCGKLAGIFPQSTSPFPVVVMGEEEELRVNPKDLRFQNLKVYCSECAPLGTLQVEGTCQVCDSPVRLHVSHYADLVLPDKKPALVRIMRKMFTAGGNLAWCSEEHLDQNRGEQKIEKRELALV